MYYKEIIVQYLQKDRGVKEKVKKILVITSLLMGLFAAVTQAAYENISIEVNSNTKEFTVSGEINGLERNEPVKFILLKTQSDTFSAKEIVGTNEGYTQGKKSFSFCEKLSDDDGGEYRYYIVSNSGGIHSDSFMYITKGTLKNALGELDSYTADEIGGWLEKNAVNFELDKLSVYPAYIGFDPEEDKDELTFVHTALEKVDFEIAEDGSDLLEKQKLLKDSFEEAVIVVLANAVDSEDAEAIKGFLSDYSYKFVIMDSIVEKTEALTDEENNDLLKKTFSGDFDTYDVILTSYYENVILKLLGDSSHWCDVSELFEGFPDILAVDEELLGEIEEDEVGSVYLALVGKSFDTIDEAITAFSEACEDVIDSRKEENKGSSGGGSSSGGVVSSGGGSFSGGSSGGGSAFGAVFTPAPIIEPTEEDIATEEIFTDLDTVEWAKEYINELAKQKVISGYGDGRFGPNDNVTRGQFARILVNAFGLVAENGKEAPFTDVPAGHIFKDAVDTVYSMGVVYGINEDTFDVDGAISREDACTIICRAFDILGFNFEGGELTFDDSDAISEYARDKVAVMAGLEIVNGDGVNFNPKNSITRAELSRIICLSIEKILG